MKEHDRGRVETLQQMINLSSDAARSVLYQLNGRDDICYMGGHKLYYREPLLSRTSRGRHYRMAPAMAELLLAEVVEPAGAHPTKPTTVLVTLEETMIRLESYVEGRELEPSAIANGIREAMSIAR